MSIFVVTIIGWALLIVLLEFLLWKLFKRRVVRICFAGAGVPPCSSTLMLRMRILAVLHTLFLFTIIFLTHWFLW